MTTLADSIVPEPFADRVEVLFDELQLALEFDRPSILLAVYRSEWVRADVEAALAEKLRPLGQRIERVFINEENYDLPVHLRARADRATTIYCVSGMRFGGGEDGRNAYRALNIRREYFVDDRLRVIFWLTESEAFNLPRYAPDFWAFRHRTVEFMDAPQPGHISQHADGLTWREWGDNTFSEDTAAKIAYREQLLFDLPDEPERTAARANLLYSLGPLYAAQGEYEKSIATFQEAIALDPKDAHPHNGLGNVYADLGRTAEAAAAYQAAIALDPKYAAPHNGLGTVYADLGRTDEAVAAYQAAIALDPKYAHPHNGLGNVYRSLGRTAEAVAAYQKAIALDPKDAAPHYGLGNVYRSLGRTAEAVAAYQKAIELDPKYAYPHYGLGNVYRSLGRTAEAVAAYQKAIELDPKDANPQMSLAAVYRKLGQTAAYNQQIEIARPLAAKEKDVYNRACFASIAGDVEEALRLLEEHLAIAPGMRQAARRDPDFEFIRDDPRFQALVGA